MSFQQDLLTLIPTNTFDTIMALSILCGLSCIGLPRQVVAFTCGYFFDITFGAFYATTTVTLAAFITFRLATFFQTSYIASKYNKQLGKLSSFLSVNTFSKTLIIRLLPIGSNFLTNILAGIANVPLTPYLCGSCIGFIPQMVIFSLMGSGVKLAESTHIITAALLLVIATFIGWKLHRNNKKHII